MLTDFQKLAEETILSQYSTSKHIKGLIYAFKDKIDPTGEIQEFYDKIFNFETAEDYGLDIWGIIVAANRFIDAVTGKYFGYNTIENSSAYDPETYNSFYPYNQAPFWYDAGTTSLYKLGREAWRTVIKLKMAINIGNATLPFLNAYIKSLFDNDRCYCTNSGTMTVGFTIFGSTANNMALFRAYTPYLVGAGVKILYRVNGDNVDHFGFRNSEGLPLNQAPYIYTQSSYTELTT